MGCLLLPIYLLAVFLSSHLAIAYKINESQIPKCSQLLMRKEWRTFTRSEKAEWVGAVKVRLTSSCLSNTCVADVE
jgi:tyrosinase